MSIINLKSLLDLSIKLNESDNHEFIISSTLLSLMGKLLITKAVVYYADDNKQFHQLINKGNFEILFEKQNLPIEFTDLTYLNQDCVFCKQGVNFIIPLIINGDIRYVFLLGKSLIEHKLSRDEVDYISLISNICTSAIRNAHTIESYRKAKENAERHTQLLSTIFEAGRDFSNFIHRDQIIKTLALNLMGQFTISKFAIFILDENGNYNEIFNRFPFKFDNDYLANICNSEITIQIENDDNISIVAPMKVKGERKGLMLLGRKLNQNCFSDNEILFIEAIGNTAIAALENERLFKEELEKKRLEGELNAALEIQQQLLPKIPPQLTNLDIYGISIPSRHVGGDYFDYIKIADKQYLLVIADVSGKGIPAALIMSNIQATLQLLTKSEFTLANLIQKVNKHLYDNTTPDKFVTGFFALIDDDSKTIEYLNAGHNPPYIIKDNNIEMLSEGGLILGFLENPPIYNSQRIQLEDNQIIVCFTDGVNEARDIDSNEYGDDRLIEASIKNQLKSSKEIALNIIDDVNNFVGDNTQYDDITLLVIKKNQLGNKYANI